MNDLRAIPRPGCQDLDIQSSRFYDALFMGGFVSGRRSVREKAREPHGKELSEFVCGTSGNVGGRDALKAAIRAYAQAYRIGAAHEIDRTWAACMQQLEQIP